MSGKPKRMSQIKQILHLRKNGDPIKAISRTVQVSRNTIKSLLGKIEAGGWNLDQLLEMEDPVLESHLYAGNAAYMEDRFEKLKNDLDYYASELKKAHVTKNLLWEEYKSVQPDGYSRSQFHYHLLQHIRAQNPSMVLDHRPGNKLFIDFAGKTISYVDRVTGEIVPCQLFVACLPYSSYFFAIAVPSQKLEDFIDALACCIVFLGGVPELLVPDNLKSAVIKASPYEPEINQVLEDFANHYAMAVLPARVCKPKDKAAVEGHVKIAYAQIYARLRHQQFFCIEDLNKAIFEQVVRLNQTRMQKKPFSREEKFLAEEKPLLKSLPQTAFCIRHYREYTVAKNNHIELTQDKHYYSVPYRFIGRKVKVIYTKSLVQIYHSGELIATHLRNRVPSGYTSVKEHLASQHQHYLDRSPAYYIDRANKISEKLGELFTRIFQQDRHPEVLYNSCNGILAISKKTDQEMVEAACDIAFDHGIYSYGFFKNLIRNNMAQFARNKPESPPIPRHNNIRGKEYYQIQLTINL